MKKSFSLFFCILVAYVNSLAYDFTPKLSAALDSLDMALKNRDLYDSKSLSADENETGTLDLFANAENFDSLLNYLPDNSAEKLLVEAEICRTNGDEVMALGLLNEAMGLSQPGSRIYNELTASLARYYQSLPDKRDEYLYYLALTAIEEVKNASKNVKALSKLAVELYSIEEKDRAFNYISAAMGVFDSSSPESYMVEVLPALNSVTQSLVKENKIKTLHISVLYVLIALLVCAFVYVGVRNRKLNKEHRAVNSSLKNSINTRDVYINQLISLCAVYVEGIEDFNRLAGRKLKAGQSQDLLAMVETGKIIQDQNERFFTVFDSAVLKIFPNFVDELNSILIPDKRIVLMSADKLTPELRILAFMRLGVTDSTRISKFLGLSLNTVYTYRNRMKNRAVDRENFDLQIQGIGKNA